jgi:hypothetical protein
MKPLLWDAINPLTGTPFTWDDPNLFWGDPSYYLEPGDPGFVPYSTPAPPQPKTKKRKYMASNPTPDPIDELIAAGEDMCDGLSQHAVTLGITQNTFAKTRADLDALLAAVDAQSAAEGAQPAAYAALRTADSNGKGFIAAFIKIASITLGNDWSDDWLATGLPDNTVGVPGTQDKRFAALAGLKAYLTANPTMEISTPKVTVTAALAATLYTAISTARQGVNNALNLTKTKVMAKDAAETAFRKRYRGVIKELEDILDAEDPRWYDFGLSRPADPATPGQPANVHATALGTGRVLVQIDGARRANSFNYYKKVVNVDPEPVKLLNDKGKQLTFENLPVGASIEFTVTGVNDAGEGQASDAVSVVVT